MPSPPICYFCQIVFTRKSSTLCISTENPKAMPMSLEGFPFCTHLHGRYLAIWGLSLVEVCKYVADFSLLILSPNEKQNMWSTIFLTISNHPLIMKDMSFTYCNDMLLCTTNNLTPFTLLSLSAHCIIWFKYPQQ